MTKIIVPYVSQEDAAVDKHVSDCGPACVKMLLNWAGLAHKITLDRLEHDVDIAPRGKNRVAKFNQLMYVAGKYGLKLVYKRPVHLSAIFAEVDSGRPVLAFLHYGSITKRQSTFNGGRFVVVVGYDADHIYLHDPDWRGDSRGGGEYMQISTAEFELAYGETGSHKTGSLPYQSLFIKDARA